MRSDREGERKNGTRVELKYCEHCGSLWVRENGAGVVYCDNCQPKVADLPAPQKKRPVRLILPVHPPSLVEEYEFEIDDDGKMDFEAAGGAA